MLAVLDIQGRKLSYNFISVEYAFLLANYWNNYPTKSFEIVDKNQLDQLERLKKEMTALNRVRDEQQKRLNDRKLYHAKCLQDANTLDRQIEDLTNRLQQKKVLTGAAAKNTIHATNQTSTPASKMHTIVAAVEPLIQQTDPDVSIKVNLALWKFERLT